MKEFEIHPPKEFWQTVNTAIQKNKKVGRTKTSKHTTDKHVDEDAYLPTESFGWCKVTGCMVEDYLADGYCVKCWDNRDRTLHL